MRGICGVDVVNIWYGVCVINVCSDVYGYVYMDSVCDVYILCCVCTPKIKFYSHLQCSAKDWKGWELGQRV